MEQKRYSLAELSEHCGESSPVGHEIACHHPVAIALLKSPIHLIALKYFPSLLIGAAHPDRIPLSHLHKLNCKSPVSIPSERFNPVVYDQLR